MLPNVAKIRFTFDVIPVKRSLITVRTIRNI